MTRRTLLRAVLPAGLPALLRGQVAISVRSGLIHHVEGEVAAGDELLDPESTTFRHLEVSESLRTERGRAEILLGPGQFLRMGSAALTTLLSDDIEASEVRLQSGSAIVSWREFAKGESVTVVAGSSRIRVAKAGVYRIDVRGEKTRLRVFSGKASVTTQIGTLPPQTVTVPSKKALNLGVEERPERFDIHQLDILDRWNLRRTRITDRQARSSRRGSGRGGRGRRGGRSRLPGADRRGGVPR